MLLFNAIGCKITLGGTHTLEYYPEYIENSRKILKETSYDHTMKEYCYGDLRFIDARNTGDILSVARVLEKAGSRNIASNGSFKIPDDIVDHLNFLGGIERIPTEYKTIAESLPPIKKSSYEKETERYKEITEYFRMSETEIMNHLDKLKKFIPTIKPSEDNHPIKIKLLVENYWADVDMRYRKMLQNIEFEQHILGGSLLKSQKEDVSDFGDEDSDDDDNVEIIYNGILKRSNRVPSLLELMIFNNSIPDRFLTEYETDFNTKNDHVIAILKNIKEKSKKDSEDKQYTHYAELFETLIPSHLLPEFLK
jgi:hypothetical protein